MNYTVGDGMVAIAIAGAVVGTVVGNLFVKTMAQKQRLEILHKERMAAMEKGIPLPELPLDPLQQPSRREVEVVPILGVVLSTLAAGTMLVIYKIPPAAAPGFWVAPLPFLFLGIGLIAFHFLNRQPSR